MIIPLSTCIESLNLTEPPSILHVGCKSGRWPVQMYLSAKVKHVIWVETNRTVGIREVYGATAMHPLRQQHLCENLSDKDVYNVSGRFDTLYKQHKAQIALEDVALINVDVDGAEKILAGFGDLWVKYPNLKGVYVSNATPEVCECLSKLGFGQLLTSGTESVLFSRE